MQNSVVITGATGYIGSMLARECLNRGDRVGIICRENSNMDILRDISSHIEVCVYDSCGKDAIDVMKSFMVKFKPDLVYHMASCFAAEHQPEQVNDLIDSNIKFSTQLVEAMSIAGVNKMVVASTAWQNYQDQEYNPVCLYAATKEAFEDILKYYTAVRGIDVIKLAIFDSYGPNDPRKKLIHLLERIAKSGESLDMSGGEQELDMVYIDDIVNDFLSAGMMLISGQAHQDKYFIRSGQIVTLKELVCIFEKVYHTKLNINWGKRPYRTREVMTLARRGSSINTDAPRVSLEEGLTRIRDSKQEE